MKDLLLNEILDFNIKDGDFEIENSTYQNQNLLLISQKGDWKENPTIGCGIADFINEENLYDMFYTIKRQFENDGMEVEDIQIDNNKFKIDAKYN